MVIVFINSEMAGTSKKPLLMNPFERIPEDLLKEILQKLDSQHVCIAIGVCKTWKALLCPNLVRSLYSPHPLVSSNAFFVQLECYDTRDAMHDPAVKGKNVGVVIDMQGRLYRHGIENLPELDFEVQNIKAVTHNGLIAIARRRNARYIYVINPTVRRGEKIELLSKPQLELHPQHQSIECRYSRSRGKFHFSGVHFDTANSNFTYLVGYVVVLGDGQALTGFWIYTTSSGNWTNITRTVIFQNRFRPFGAGVYSRGCFFWCTDVAVIHDTDEEREINEERVVGFDIREQQFFYIESPQVEDEKRSKTSRSTLKGCDGWVVLVLNVDGELGRCWRLVKDEDVYGWVPLTVLYTFDFLSADFYKVGGRQYLSDGYRYLLDVNKELDIKQDLYSVNGQGWWCIAKCASEKESHSGKGKLVHEASAIAGSGEGQMYAASPLLMQRGCFCCTKARQESDSGEYDNLEGSQFSIYDEHGNLKHLIKQSQLISELGIHDRYVGVKSVWPFQINNICWPRW